jgi:hypothetical protein
MWVPYRLQKNTRSPVHIAIEGQHPPYQNSHTICLFCVPCLSGNRRRLSRHNVSIYLWHSGPGSLFLSQLPVTVTMLQFHLVLNIFHAKANLRDFRQLMLDPVGDTPVSSVYLVRVIYHSVVSAPTVKNGY